MQKETVLKKPSFQPNKKQKIQESYQSKISKVQTFYRYRIGSIYRQLRIPIYQKLLEQKKGSSNKITPKPSSHKNIQIDQQSSVQSLYKMVSLNSKYHHREKMRFSRTPLLKYIEYNFTELTQKLNSKEYQKIYDDLVESDDDEKQDDKKQYEKDSQFSQATINNYKKKNNINGKIVIAEGYEDLKHALISQYGWSQNQDKFSLIYDFKFMSKKKDLDYVNLLDNQIINHFNENKAITAKFGLTRNIRNIVILGKDHNQFFPRCYDVNDVKELQDFYQDFKYTLCKKLLNKYVQLKGKVIKKDLQVIQKVMKVLQIEILPITKKISYILMDKPIYINLQLWKQLQVFQFSSNQQQNDKDEKLIEKAIQIQKQLQKIDTQYYLNKDNIWIIKPASMSRGRGIKTFNKITQILDYIIGKQISWVAQKYIQRPLIIKKKKFDIRQWVILSDLKPFRVWVYDECYIRFCSQIYEPQNLKNRKVHLTNNSVTKGINNEEDGIQQNMMSLKDFSLQLLNLQKKQFFQQIIRPQINKIAIQSLESVKENIVFRKNTFQLFGYDFMIDQNYKVWLIEVNSSPTMEHSTKITTKIVQRGMADLAGFVQNYMYNSKIYNKKNAKELYGGWKLLINE